MPALSVENLQASYLTDVYGIKRTVRAVDGVSFQVPENTIYGIAGESGCGKSSLIKVISGTYVPPLEVQAGRVLFDGGDGPRNLLELGEGALRSLRWESIAYVPQGSMNVLNPVRRLNRTFRDFVSAHRRIGPTQAFAKSVAEHLSHLGLPGEIASAYPHQLSGGMRQRATLALATYLKPKLVIADEPTTALDVVVQRGVIQLFKRTQAEQRNTVIIVTHDMAVHANLTDRLAIMYAGKIVEEAETSEIFSAPRHPYTRFLIASLPRIGDKSCKESVPGSPPSLAHPPAGCRFHPRCPLALDRCRSEEPVLAAVRNGHRVACFLHAQAKV